MPLPRRTQEERRAGTIRKLLDAVTRTLIDLGYAHATVQEICARAGVSQGGLFRHFPSREALMCAVAEDVGAKILAHYRREFEALREREGEPRLLLAIRLVRDHVRSPLNQAWYELAFASRTHPAMRKALRPIGARYSRNIEQLGRELMPELAAALGERFALLLDTIVAVFDGEVMHRLVNKKPEIEEARVEVMVRLIGTLMGA